MCCHRHARSPGGQLRLREGVDLRAGEAVAVPRVGVGGDVEAVRVRTDVRIVAQVRAGVARRPVFVPSFVTSMR